MYSSGDCTRLHPVWFYLTTETTFPVSTGTLITVKCHDGLTNIGSEIITCQNKIHYKFDDEPGCDPHGKSLPKKVFKRIIPALHAIKFVVVINEAVCIKVFGKLKEISKTFIE